MLAALVQAWKSPSIGSDRLHSSVAGGSASRSPLDAGSADRPGAAPAAHYPSGVAQRLSGFRIGRIGGVPITVAPTGVLSVAVIAALGAPVVARVVPGTGTVAAVGVAVLLAVLLAASVLAHEIGHCIAARLLGLKVVEVRLYLLGGVSQLAGVPRSPREESIVAAVGPAVSAVLAGVFFLGVPATTPGTAGWLVLMLLALANLAVAVFNLLPALPLDGGRVLRAGVWRASGNRRAGTAAAVFGGYLVAAALAGWAVVLLVADGVAAQGFRHALGDLILHGKHVFELSIEAMRPAVVTARHFNQLHRDAQALSGLADTALEDVADGELLRHLLDVGVLPLEAEGGVAGYHLER